MLYLKQSTAATIVLGPFVDSTDGATAETGLTISQADVRLSKNGGAFAQKNDSNAASHMENGYYSVALSTTDTNTLGRLIVAVSESGALPVWAEFMVLSANVYDSLIAGSDNLQVDAVQIEGGDATDAINAACDVALADYDGPTNAEMEARTLAAASYATATALATVDNVVDAIKAVTDNLPDGGALSSLATASALSTVDGNVDAIKAVTDNLPDSGALTSLATASALSTVDGKVDAIKTVTDKLDDTLEEDSGVYRFTANALEEAPAAEGGLTASEIADAVWDEDLTEHTTEDSAGEIVQNISGGGGLTAQDVWEYESRTLTALDEDSTTLDIDSAVRSAVGLSSANLDTQLGTIDSNVDSILDDTGSSGVVVASGSKSGYSLAADQSTVTIGTVNALGAQAKADVNAEVDSALADYDPPTNAELEARTLTAASYATASAVATVDNNVDAIKAVTDKLDDTLEDQGGGTFGFTEAALQEAPTGSGPGVSAEDIWTYEPRTLTVNPGLDAAGVRAAVGLASANLDTQLITIDGNVSAIKSRTDGLTFSVTGKVDANITHVNEIEVKGTGVEGDEWGPA